MSWGQQRIVTPNPAVRVSPEARWNFDAPPRVRLVAARNGSATAPVVLPGMRNAVRAQVGDLQAEQGGPAFPARFLEIRYGWQGLSPEPEVSSDGAVVWITANVPAGTPPGRYGGQMQIPGAGTVPVLLEVGRWVAPAPAARATWQSLLQSPASVARHYNVTKWSDEHFRYLEHSIRLMGQIGNHTLYIPAVGRSHLGDEVSMIRWTGSGGNVQPEFTALERYLELWERHAGPPRKVIFYMVEGSWWSRSRPVRVTTVSRPGQPGGQVEEWPHFTQSGQAERWRAAIGGTLQRIRARGWTDTELLIGVVGDERNFSEAMVRFFEVAAPGLNWATFTHGRGDPRMPSRMGEVHLLGPFGFTFVEYPYSPDQRNLTNNPLSGPPSRARDAFPFLTSFREVHTNNRILQSTPGLFFFMPFAARQGRGRQYVGFGRIGMDFWDLASEGGVLIGRFERWHNLYRDNPRFIFYPGTAGALASQQSEMLREGSVLAEAMLQLHEAVTLPEHAERVPSEVRERARAAYMGLYEHFHAAWAGQNNRTPEQLHHLEGVDWQTPLRTVYDVAGEVAELLGGGVAAAGPNLAPVAAEPRVWTSNTGDRIEGRFLGVQQGLVGIELADGRRLAIPLDRFSEEDLAWIRAQ